MSESVINPSWEELGACKRAALLASIPEDWRIPSELLPPDTQDDITTWPAASGWFSEAELVITEATATELLPLLASGQMKSEDVTRAFCKRAAAAHILTNCLSETCFERAMTTARALDKTLARTGQPVGPLHGLPLSLKDNFNLKGLDSTVGLTSHVGSPADSDSTLAEILEGAGAVFYVKTNTPTAMMIMETVNNVTGRTLNPKNKRSISGGSSGGESALISFKGSPLGVGSDIGGSLRIPAACTGLFTIRPTFGRFPSRNTRSGMPGQEAIPSVNGPLARTLSDIYLYCRAVVDAKPWTHDPRSLPIPWRSVELPKTLKIGVMWHDGLVFPTPPVARVLRETVHKLKEAGHTIVEWDPADQIQGLRLMERMFVADGGAAIGSELKRTGEPWRPELELYETASDVGVSAMWKIHLERVDFQNRYFDRWNKTGIDAIICPTMAYNNMKIGGARHVGYTGVFNVLDYSCVSFPTGFNVDKNIDVRCADYSPLSPLCQAIHDEYDANLMHGLPISLQLVAQRFEEEKVIAMTQCVLEAL